MKVCPHCGLENPSHSECCARCDADLAGVRPTEARQQPPTQAYQQQSPRQYQQQPPKKRHTLRNVLIVLGLLVVVGVSIGVTQSGGEEATVTTRAAVETTQTTVPHEAQWTTIVTLSGTADKRSELFTLTGAPARLTYDVKGGSDGYLLWVVYLMEEGTSLDKQGGIPEVDVDTDASDSTMLYREAGTYYLDVGGNATSWTVTIEEER